jgi:2-C-methyl-D-erythritol 4-phosphate cytidylyltransferase/2-C-methyl-D-erythritol 2,4-cyclodiphosphate synthase
MHVTAIIAAGGRGQRFGGRLPKQLVSIGGRSLLERSVAVFLTHPEVDEVIVALPAELVGDPPRFLTTGSRPVRIVAGGDRRQDSVTNGFRAASERTDVIVVHDAARPFATASLVSRTIAAAAESGAAIAALAAGDTVKRGGSRQAAPEGGPGGTPSDGSAAPPEIFRREAGQYVLETLPRRSIFLAQTPQAFRREVLRDALALADAAVEVTDEATLAERAGHAVRIVEGERTNIKITTPEDLVVAQAIAAGSARDGAAPDARTRLGTGYDLHTLVEGRPLILGGVTIPSDRGALGHSDADVVCHSVTDAILGAGNLGDIGRHFPDTDPRWKGASSLDLLARASALVAERGFAVGNVDVTVILERPKIKDHVDAMRRAVAAALGVELDRVSIKGKTNEGVDAVGRGEAIVAHAVALLVDRLG